MNTENDLEKKVKHLLRRVDQTVQREDERNHNYGDSSWGSANQSIIKLVPESLFGIGMGFIMLFTAMLAIVFNGQAYKIMCGVFSAICLVICAYKLDKVARELRRLSGSNSQD